MARLLAIFAGLLVIVETVWMLPLLDLRVGLIIAGTTPPPADLHQLYIAMEVAKLLVLAAISFGSATFQSGERLAQEIARRIRRA